MVFLRLELILRQFSIKLFGLLEVSGTDGAVLALSGKKPQALLALLALNAGQPQSRDWLAEMLWGDRINDQARQSLRQCISNLRKTFSNEASEVLAADSNHITLNIDAAHIDLLEFEALAARNDRQALSDALKLYDEPLLTGFYIKQSGFDDWLSGERARIDELALDVLERLAELQIGNGDTGAAITTYRRALSLDPLSEQTHRSLMQLYANNGQRAAALKQFRTCCTILENELSAKPDGITQNFYNEILSRQAEAPTAQPTPAKIQASPRREKPTIAVLPLDDMSGAADQQYFADGVTEDIITALTKYRWLSVIARNSTFSYKGKSPDVRQVGAELGAGYVVEGSIQKSGNRVRVSAQVIDTSTGSHIWAERYDRSIDDIFAVQDEITETIAATIEPELAAAESQRAATKPTESLQAWDCYHLGLSHLYKFSQESNAEAQKLFRRAISIDSDFGAAHARLSYAMVLSAVYFDAQATSDLMDDALLNARRATALDNQDALAHFAVGRVYLARGEYDMSIAELRTAINLNPSMAQAHCGLGDSLAYAGKLEQSISCFEEAVRLSPHDPYRWGFLMYGSLAYLFLKRHEEAADWARNAIRIPNSHYRSNAVLVSALGHLVRPDEAEQARDELLRLKSDFSCRFAREHLFYVKDPAQVDHYVDGLRKAGVVE